MLQKAAASWSFQICRRGQEVDSQTTITLAGPSNRVTVKLLDKKSLTEDTRRFRFALPSPDQSLGIPIGNFIQITVIVDGKEETRSYTPISTNEDRGNE